MVIKSILSGLTSIKAELSPGKKKEMKSTYNFYKLFGLLIFNIIQDFNNSTLFSYDIMLDNQCQPKLVEINARPAALNDKERMLIFLIP